MSTSLLFKKHIYVLLYDYITTLHNLQQYAFDLKYGNNSAVLAKNGATLNLKNLRSGFSAIKKYLLKTQKIKI